MSRGGQRPGAGRKKGAPTQRISVPASMVPIIQEMMDNEETRERVQREMDNFRAHANVAEEYARLKATESLLRAKEKRIEEKTKHWWRTNVAPLRRRNGELSKKMDELKQENSRVRYTLFKHNPDKYAELFREDLARLGARLGATQPGLNKDPLPLKVWRFLVQLAHPDRHA